jgi:Phasin protein
MPQNDPQAEKSTIPDIFPAGLAEAGLKRVEDVMSLQTELVTYLQEVNQNWFNHMQSETAIASEFANKLTAARSLPDVATAWQEWANRRMELLAQDGRHLLADAEKFLETGTRVFGNGWVAANPEAKTQVSGASGRRPRGTHAQPQAPQA